MNKDLTVSRRSLLLSDIFNGKRKMKLPDGFKLNGVTRHWLMYILSDVIYPPWCILAKPNNAPLSESGSIYTKMQKDLRKDKERFSVFYRVVLE